MSGPTGDLEEELRASAVRAAAVGEVASALQVTYSRAKDIVEAFDKFVAQPLVANLAKLRGSDLARRNPMIYTARGTHTIDDWVDRVLGDRETSAIEGHIGTWLEEVAQIVSGGIKPGSGVDLQLTAADGGTTLYAIQSAPNTKNAGSRKSDIEALKRAARPLRAHKKHVELRIAVLWGRGKSGEVGGERNRCLVSAGRCAFKRRGRADSR